MRGECPELKKKLKKEKFTFKKAKAMLATWSDEDEDEDSQHNSGNDEVHCLMARSNDSTECLSTTTNLAIDNKAFPETPFTGIQYLSTGSVDTLSRTAKQVFWELNLVSTPLEAVSTHSTDLSIGISGSWD
ncbi:hypothetical protein Taro_040856 [Colocasia esculenta]|uniref:Uncharacterized protein n=1 Tax=Colocasia esculenta TaxID=4460 RepID=A0A843WRN7_COLES|nr:hypothetical protein [Colocasia esculenta]